MVSILHRAALSARYWGYDGHPLELAEDLAGLLRAEINLTGGTLLHAATGDREQLLFFENWARLHAGRITHHLAQLNRLVSRENESWR